MSKPFTPNWTPEETPLVILAEGCFGQSESKTALGVIRYGRWPVTAVLDSRLAGQTVQSILDVSCRAPIVATLQEALSLSPSPEALLMGTAPMGGGLPEPYRDVVKEAISQGLHIISGLHVFLNQDSELLALAEQHHVLLWDVRATSDENIITRQLPRPSSVQVITFVGSDCSVGKMTAALALQKGLLEQGEKAEFVATGQTGIMITGSGVPLDRVIGDFMAGTLEAEIDRVIQQHQPDWVLVEGQGSLLHPAYSGVSLSLLHGSAPDALIFCHNPQRHTIRNYESVVFPAITDMIGIVEAAAGWIKPARVLGVMLNTMGCSEPAAKEFIQTYTQETGLPVTDPVRFGVSAFIEALQYDKEASTPSRHV